MSFRGSIGDIKRPITMVAGWHDMFLPWQMHDFSALQSAGCETRITVGPWRHNDMELWQAGLRDAIEWFDRHLRGKDTAPKRKPVKLYVIGANEWREFDAWPPRESRLEHWYLQPQRKLLDRIAPDSPADQYRYDPADPTPSAGRPCARSRTLFSRQRRARSARRCAHVHVRAAAAGARPHRRRGGGAVRIVERAKRRLFRAALRCGRQRRSKNICDGLQRVRIESANTPQRVRVELWPTAYRIAKGHRIRVQISSGAFPRWARNLGSAEPIAHATELRAATQNIHHSPACGSAVILPFIEDGSQAANR